MARMTGAGFVTTLLVLAIARADPILVDPTFNTSGPDQHKGVMRLRLCEGRVKACGPKKKTQFVINSGRPDDIIAVNNTKHQLGELHLSIRNTLEDVAWGDANNDGKVGLSNIFETTELSADKKTIVFKKGTIAAGDPKAQDRDNPQFTDFKALKPVGGATLISVDSFFELPRPRVDDEGGGQATLPGGIPPGGPFAFSRALFTTFAGSRVLEMPDDVTLDLSLVGFESLIEFSPTEDPDVFLARFTAFDFEYAPFDVPGTVFTDVVRQALDESMAPDFSGEYVVSTGEFFLDVPTLWLDSNGAIVARTLEFFQFFLTPLSPTEAELLYLSQGSFRVVPEPGGLAALGLGVLAILGRRAWSRRSRRAG